MCHFTLDYNFHISWWISTFCAPMEKRNKYSTLRFTYLVVPRRLWPHNCVTSQRHECLLCEWIISLILSFEDKIFIKNLWECKRFSARRLLSEYPNKNWKRRTLDEFLWRLRTTGSIERKEGSSCPWSCCFVFLNFLK